jgi:hypothetical protein
MPTSCDDHPWLAQAAAWDRATHTRGKHGGVLGGPKALRVYRVLLRECLAQHSGPAELTQTTIAAEADVSLGTACQALRRLQALRMVCCEARIRETTRYTVFPPEYWASDTPLPPPIASCDPDAVMAGRQLRAARTLIGWSAARLAHAAGLAVATVGRLEAARMTGRPPTLDAIRDALAAAGVVLTPEGGVAPRRFGADPAG